MVWNPVTQKYEITIVGQTAGTYSFTVFSEKTGDSSVIGAATSGQIVVRQNEAKYITFTPIENISSWHYGSIDIYPTNEENQIIFSLDNNAGSAKSAEMIIHNSLNDGKQYFVYTASQTNYDVNEWTFNDSLTYNSPTDSKPIQKIWHSEENIYWHSFQDTLLAGEKKYYKILYNNPAFFWAQQNDDWFKQSTPTNFSDSGITWDSFTLSTYSNLKNYPQKELSQLISNQNVAYEFQFTGYTEDLNANVGVYLLDPNNTETLIETVNLTTTKTRFSVSINPNQFAQKIMLKTTQVYPVTIFLVDYAIVPRGYFTSPLKILQSDGSELPTIVQYPNFYQYVQETENFLARTTVFDRNGDLNQLVVTAYFDVNSDSNTAKKYFIPLDSTGSQTLEQSFSDILDLTDSAQNIIIKFTLYDKTGLAVAEQSKTIRFLQWPYFPSDLRFSFADNALIVGDNPNGVVTLTTTQPNNILGVEFYIYKDNNSPTTANYYTQIFQPQDFQCNGNDCSFNYSIPDFAFSQDSNKWFITGQVLMRTKNRTVPSLTDNAVPYVYTVTKTINFFALKTARIIQTFERLDHKYKNTEPIALTVELQNVLNDDIRKDLRVWIELFDCADQATGTCNANKATYVYNPVSSIYDPATGKNYFFFKNLFLTTPDSNLLTDGNYYRAVAYVSDASGKYQDAGTLNILLGCKTAKDDVGDNCSAATVLLTTPSPNIITTVTNATFEKRILIDNSITLSPPNLEFLGCLRLDTNLVFDSPKKPVLTCFVGYSIKNTFPNQFNFRLTNNNSNTDEPRAPYQQFIDFTVPYDVLSVNDLTTLKKALGTNYHTICENFFCTMGQYANYIVANFANAYGENVWNWTLGDMNNFVWYNTGADVNFSHFFDPTYVSGILAIQVSNTNFINKKDYENAIPELKQVNPKYFIRFMRDNGKTLPDTTTHISIFADSLEPFLEFDKTNFLVINEAQKPKATQNNSDSNAVLNPQSLFIPTVLTVNFGATMLYDNALSSQYLYTPLTFKTIISSQTPFWNNLGGALSEFSNDPIGFLYKNIFFVAIFIGLLFIVIVIIFVAGRAYGAFKGG